MTPFFNLWLGGYKMITLLSQWPSGVSSSGTLRVCQGFSFHRVNYDGPFILQGRFRPHPDTHKDLFNNCMDLLLAVQSLWLSKIDKWLEKEVTFLAEWRCPLATGAKWISQWCTCPDSTFATVKLSPTEKRERHASFIDWRWEITSALWYIHIWFQKVVFAL